jgi:hypothetical protein
MKKILFVAALAAIFSSCKKDDKSFDTTSKGEIIVEFDNIAGAADLQLNTESYTNATGESFKVTKLKYYVSNFSFTKTDGSIYTMPQDSSYFLIDESDADSQEPTMSIPEGEYKTVSFLVGVDSLRNTMDLSKRTGVLDPAGAGTGMYVNQNTGYTHFLLEGTSPASSQPSNAFKYSIAYYGGSTTATVNNTRRVTLDLTARGTAKVKNGKETEVHLMVDVLKIFTGATTVSITSTPAIQAEAGSAGIANNYAAMFTHDHTHN